MSYIGEYSLRFALVVAAAGFGAGIYAGITHRADWTRVAERAVYVVFGFTTLAMLGLFYSFATSDFQLAYVAQNSARSMAFPYRLAALWGGQAGSLLLWAWLLCGYGSAAMWAHRRKHRSLVPWVAATLLANAIFFLVLTNFVTEPFERLAPGRLAGRKAGLKSSRGITPQRNLNALPGATLPSW